MEAWAGDKTTVLPDHYSALEIMSQSETQIQVLGFPHGSNNKESACKARDLGLIPGWGRSSGEGNDNPL